MIKMYHGDCREILDGFRENYFSLVVIDSPYGIEIDRNYITIAGKRLVWKVWRLLMSVRIN